MMKLTLAAALATAIAAPAVAQTQLERSLGVEAGQFTVSELAKLKAVETEEGNDARVFFGNQVIRFSSLNLHNDRAASIFDQINAASKEDE